MNKGVKSSLSARIEAFVSGLSNSFSLNEIYGEFPEEKRTTIRGRVYRELLGRGVVKRVSEGLYEFTGTNGQAGLVLQGDARQLKAIGDSMISLIIADHPYMVKTGRSRCFTKGYEETIFEYNQSDFDEKARVLQVGSFLVEFLPEMKNDNFEYLTKILSYAKSAGFQLYAKVPWYKAEVRESGLVDYSANVGRKGVMEDVYIFSKGKPRALRQRMQSGKLQMESGAKEILPAVFMERPLRGSDKNHQSAKPPKLIGRLIELLTQEMELVLDQFAGSFVTFWEAIRLNRNAVAVELNPEFISKSFLMDKEGCVS